MVFRPVGDTHRGLAVWLFCLAIAFASLGAAAQNTMPVTFSAVLALDAREPDATFNYGAHPSQTSALWLPRREGPVPLLVLLHGGCWLAEYSAPHVYPLAARLAKDGYAVYVPEYRRVGEEGGGWPGTAADVVRALDFLATQENSRINLGHTLLLGHSAGGHLALWLAARDPSLGPRELVLAGAIGLAPITDLLRYAEGEGSCQQAAIAFMGTSPLAAPERYLGASPAHLPKPLPLLLLRGSEDSIVGAEQVTAMGPAVATQELPGAGHFDWIHPDTPAYDLLRDSIFDLLSRSYGGAAP